MRGRPGYPASSAPVLRRNRDADRLSGNRVRVYVTATVLIVDDSTFIVEGLVAILRKSFRALPSFGGEECLAILRTEKPDLIVLDIMMEPMDGWETLSRIKENPETRHIPVLMFSAKKISPEEAETHRIRIDDFLTKPVDPRNLVTAIEKILEREKRNRAILHYWAKAGISRDMIDEYLTWSSNLEVDSSLLVAMKKQLGHPTTTPVRRHDLEASIAMLEERIKKGQDAIAEYFNKTGLSFPTQPEIDEICTSVPEASPGSGDADTEIPFTPLPEPEPVVAGSRAPAINTEPDQPVPPAADLPDAAEASSSSETPVPLPEPAVASPVSSDIVPGSPAGAPAAKPQEPVETMPDVADRIEWIPIPSRADPFTDAKRPVIEHPVKTETVEEAPGAGTPAHIPLPSILRSGREEREPEKKTVPATPPPGGFFSRIIAVISGLFGRRK